MIPTVTQFNTIYSGDLYQFDPAKQKWTELTKSISSPLPAGRCGMGFTSSQGRLLVFGGCTNGREYPRRASKETCFKVLVVCGQVHREQFDRILILFFTTTVQKDLWAIYPPKRIQWPSRSKEDFFIDVYDWDTLELLPGSESRLSLAVELCFGLFPCSISVEGHPGTSLHRSSDGQILCLNQLGCSSVQVS